MKGAWLSDDGSRGEPCLRRSVFNGDAKCTPATIVTQNVVQGPGHFFPEHLNETRTRQKQCNLFHIHTLCTALLILLNPRNIDTTVVDVCWSDLSCPQPLGLLRFFIRTTHSVVWGLRPTIAPWMFCLSKTNGSWLRFLAVLRTRSTCKSLVPARDVHLESVCSWSPWNPDQAAEERGCAVPQR